MHHTFSAESFEDICRQLGTIDADLQSVVAQYGYPPFWSRDNSFETLVQIILEQQVSLASARAAFEKLQAHLGRITPANVISLRDDEFRSDYVSRQKAGYIRHAAQAVLDGTLDFDELEQLPDDEIRSRLLQLKGVGNWTVDVYLIMVLHRADHFPMGDIAAVNGLKSLKNLPKDTSADEVWALTEVWRPHRSVATMLIWHDYLSRRKKA